MTIGERIKRRRLELSMTQEELARKLGYKSKSSINKIELDSRNLTQPKIKLIADALLTTPEYIMGWDKVQEKGQDGGYYFDDETAALAQEIFFNKELRLLINDARDASEQDIKVAHEMLLAMKRKERHD